MTCQLTLCLCVCQAPPPPPMSADVLSVCLPGSAPLNDTVDEDDPEYDFLEEAAKEGIDSEDFRDDKMSHIPSERQSPASHRLLTG